MPKGSKHCFVITSLSTKDVQRLFEDALFKLGMFRLTKWRPCRISTELSDNAVGAEMVPKGMLQNLQSETAQRRAGVGTKIALDAHHEPAFGGTVAEMWATEPNTMAGMMMGSTLVGHEFMRVVRAIQSADPTARVSWDRLPERERSRDFAGPARPRDLNAALADLLERAFAPGTFQQSGPGAFTASLGSATIIVGATADDSHPVIWLIEVVCPLAIDVGLDAGLAWALLEASGQSIGSFYSFPSSNGEAISYSVCLMGGFVDHHRLRYAIGAVAAMGDAWDDELVRRGGGLRWHDIKDAY